MTLELENSYLTDQERWEAVMHRDKNADGAFFYSVKTMGVYCRPSCPARLPRFENVAFHLTPADAEHAGFRACKRCKPKSTEFGAAKIRYAVGDCSLGSILIAASDLGICSIAIGDGPDMLMSELRERFADVEILAADRECERMLARVVAFVVKPSMGLDLPLDIQGTAFQQRVWQALREIPCGTTSTYSELAQRLGQPSATRAVAGACAANTLAVVIPCHRVVRADGSLSGYRWGVERKAKLLRVEGASA